MKNVIYVIVFFIGGFLLATAYYNDQKQQKLDTSWKYTKIITKVVKTMKEHELPVNTITSRVLYTSTINQKTLHNTSNNSVVCVLDLTKLENEGHEQKVIYIRPNQSRLVVTPTTKSWNYFCIGV